MNKRKIAMKALKVLGYVLLGVLVLVLTLPLWINPVGRPIVRSVISGYTGTEVALEELHVNPYTARFELKGLSIGNPPGYKTGEALKIGHLLIDLKTRSLFGDVVEIEDVVLEDFEIVMDTDAAGVGNFTAIAKQAMGEKAEKEEKEDDSEKSEGKDRRFLIDHVLLRNIRIRYFTPSVSLLKLKLPTPDVDYTVNSIELNRLGHDIGGYGADNLWPTLVNLFWEAMRQKGVDLMKFGIGDLDELTATAFGEGAKVLEKLKADGTVDAVKDAAKDAAKKILNAPDSTVDSLKDAAKGVSGALKGLLN